MEAQQDGTLFRHPGGYEVETREPYIRAALGRLHDVWPRALRLSDLFSDVAQAADDLILLYRNGLIELRHDEGATGVDQASLHRLERAWGGYRTSGHHQLLSEDAA